MVSYLLLSGLIVPTYSLLMGSISVYSLIVKLKNMRTEIQISNHEIIESKVNTNIILWWAGTFLGKRLHSMMSEKLS